ncbi:MAG: AraC family transcriptional regulator [Cyclobacteriaceae bacterium]|nr:AraC family transcriptional regulator [Cyclobacteriaceae bacterium]
MNKIKQQTILFKGENGSIFKADTCLSLVDAIERGKVDFKALARHSYPGDRLTDDTIGLNTIGYWSSSETQDWGLDWHRNEGIEFHFLESGMMPYAAENNEVDLLPGDFTVTRPWQQHRVGNPNVGVGKFYWVILDVGVRRPHQHWTWPDWIILSDKDLQRLTLFFRQNDQPVWKATPEIKDCFKQIGQTLHKDVNGSSASKIRLLVNELLILTLEMLERGQMELNESLTDSLRSASQFIEELSSNLDHPWTIEKMANSAGLGVTRFTHHCRQLTNLTPMQFLTKKRIEWAKKILKEKPQMNSAQVAYTCGFATSQYFSTVFKKFEKCSPQEYRNKVSQADRLQSA